MQTVPKLLHTRAGEEEALKQYEEMCTKVGVFPPDSLARKFEMLLTANDWPVYNLHEVVRYMDALAERDNSEQTGWQWVPMRERDATSPIIFGPEPILRGPAPIMKWWWRHPVVYEQVPFYSNYYSSRDRGGWWMSELRWPRSFVDGKHRLELARPYNRAVPMKVLQKIATIEETLGAGKVVFLVSDFAPMAMPPISLDPFLMAVIPNDRINQDVGLYVIDVWDEPGFGITEMLK